MSSSPSTTSATPPASAASFERPAPAVLPTPAFSSGAQIKRVGMPRPGFSDLYHFFLTSSWSLLFALVVVLYVVVNSLFALAYFLDTGGIENAGLHSYSDAFFFSVQTMATIGYGKMVPRSVFSNVLVTVEALSGLLGFALSTSLLFAKFSRPTSRVLFSDSAIVQLRDGVPCLMFRMANARANQIVEAQLRLVLLRTETTKEGEESRRFVDLKLARSQTAIFALSWTAIHPIDESSPLYGQTVESLARGEAALVVSLVGIDETFSQTVHARHTYRISDILWGGRFVDIFRRGPDGERYLDYSHFHEVIPGPDPTARGAATAQLASPPQAAEVLPR